MALVLYVIICKDDKAECVRNCAIPRRYVTPVKNYIGLREKVSDAVERRQKIWGCAVTDDTHEVLKVTVTLEGVADLVLRASASEDHFASTLYKKPYYRDKDTDWKVWHYIGDLPLQGNVTYDEKLYTAEWLPLSSCFTV
jgi:hypothetical protein